MFERAVATFNRELRYTLHKVHLLCLVAHGLQLSQQCACPVLQAILLSMVPRELCCLETHPPSRESLQKLLRWFSAESVTLRKTVEASCPEFCCSVVSQLLVALLMAVGLRARVVLVLDPVPFKAAGKKPQSRDSGEEIAKTSPSGVKGGVKTRSGSTSIVEIVSTVVKGNSDRNLNPKDVKLKVKRDASSEASIQSQEDEMRTKARKRGASPLPVDSQVPTSSKKRRTSANSRAANSSNCDQELESAAMGDTACSPKSARKRKGKGRGRRGSKTVPSAPSCKSSPYFKKRGMSRKLARGWRGGSESASNHSRSSDEDFVPQTKLSRFSSAEKTEEVAQSGSGEGSCSDSSETETRVLKKGKSKLSKGKGSKSTMSLAKKIKAAAEGVSGSSPGREDEGEQSGCQQSSGADEKAGGESAFKKGALYGKTVLDHYTFIFTFTRSFHLYYIISLSSTLHHCPFITSSFHYIISFSHACSDDTTSWVEVYLQPEQKWVCLHSPSLSVAQPKMCEKHCMGRSISYVIAVEKGKLTGLLSGESHCILHVEYLNTSIFHMIKEPLESGASL